MHFVIIHSMIILILLGASDANANNMINNKAQASVLGQIIQEAKGQSNNTVNIGSIVKKSARNISVNAVVEGDVIVKTSKKVSTTLNIGSYAGQK